MKSQPTSLVASAPGMRPRTGWLQGHPSAVLAGVDGELPAIPQHFSAHRSRNNQLLLAALMQIQPQVDDAIARFGRDRIAVVLGTSTSGLDEGDVHVDLMLNGKESTDWRYPQQELGDPSRFLSHWLALDGPAFTLSTACSSSARAIMSGRRLIESGLVDIAIVGGADTLSRMPINGFHSLESLSPTLCQPFGRDRCGITIGEGAALMVLTREPQPIALLGVGESSDAYHISAPHPQGEGAIRAIGQALNDAGMTPEHVGYINLHGTATPLNDQIECQRRERAIWRNGPVQFNQTPDRAHTGRRGDHRSSYRCVDSATLPAATTRRILASHHAMKHCQPAASLNSRSH